MGPPLCSSIVLSRRPRKTLGTRYMSRYFSTLIPLVQLGCEHGAAYRHGCTRGGGTSRPTTSGSLPAPKVTHPSANSPSNGELYLSALFGKPLARSARLRLL